jgi:nicotinate-nucleotide adenylyltransferase
MRIGLFGGSFDPAHAGHALVAETALRRLQLDAVWWLVTPQNPLKAESAGLHQRLASARRMAHGRRHVVTDVETRLGVRFTADTLAALQAHYPGVRFVWVMGADGADSFRRWRRWRDILAAAPVLVVARPGATPPRAMPFPPAHRRPANRTLPFASPPAWAFAPVRLEPASSTAMRARRSVAR